MAKSRQYFHDRTILFFLTVNAFLVFATAVSLLLRLGGSSEDYYIKEYRANLGLDAFKTGGAIDIIAFILFAVIVFVLQFLLSRRIYPFRRDGALIIIFMSTLSLVFALIIGNALLTIS